MNIGYLLSKASRLSKWDLNIRLNEIDLTTSQFIILKDIYNHETQNEPEKLLTPAAIALRLNSDRPTVTGIVQRLISNDWVFKKANSNDKRSFYLVLTDKAKETMPKLEELSEETIKKAINGLSEEDVTKLKLFLDHIINNLT